MCIIKLLSTIQTLVDDVIIRPVLFQTNTITQIMTLLAPFKMWCSSSSTETLRQCFQIFPPKPYFLSCMNGKRNSLWILLAPAQIQSACGLKWQMIVCYCRGSWGLSAQPRPRHWQPLQGSVAAAYPEHITKHPPTHNSHRSRGSQPGWPLKPQGCQIHTSPCLFGNSVTETSIISLGSNQYLLKA